VLPELVEHGGDPAEVARRHGFEQLGTEELESAIDGVISASPTEWERYVSGDARIAGFLAGQVMKATRGRANGKAVAEALAARRAGVSAR
ncbi:MAG: Asp-tRNA(Asn)/Glu-tRNA(Gln) amidotransferase subunit GatB, partial [Actinomycetota bacterium]|nr:Asp-tRNA(Asn)/Glu-tRNA(Gln) amidotransferase subunit GatB [Actinomycetota bacterium]